jgi:hypothetical protein
LAYDEQSHNLGLYCSYERGKLKNKLTGYGSLTKYSDYVDSNQQNQDNIQDWMKDLKSRSKLF